MSAKPNMLHHIAALLHLPTLVDAKAWKRINAAGGYAVDEDDVKTIVIRLRESYDEMRAEAAAEVTALKAQLAEKQWHGATHKALMDWQEEAMGIRIKLEASLSECRAQLAASDDIGRTAARMGADVLVRSTAAEASLGESLDLLERNQKWHGRLASSGKPCCCVNCEESRAFLAKHGRKP